MVLGNVRVFHLKSSEQKLGKLPHGFHVFGTCLRTLVLTCEKSAPKALEGFECFSGSDAYSHCLRIITGAESPVYGETQVLGQFKEFVKNERAAMSAPLLFWISNLMGDAKHVRTQFMQNLGSHSYGSLLRRSIEKDMESIHFVGAGKLTQEILPWVIKNVTDVKVFSRSPSKYKNMEFSGRTIKVQGYDAFGDGGAEIIVIAAPIAAKDFQDILSSKKPKIVFDLRGNCDEDPLVGFNVHRLTQLFKEIQSNQVQLQKVRRQVEKFIVEKALSREMSEKPRPFGWDDLWAI